MHILQYITLGLFGLFAVLTAFFQLRAGMKSGEATRADTQETVRDAGRQYSRIASRCAVLSVVFLALCMVFGAMNR